MRRVLCFAAIALCLVIGIGCGSSSSGGNSLAAKIAGTYEGLMQTPLGTTAGFRIVVTEIDDTTVQIRPASGSVSSTFTATLTSSMQGEFEVITIHATDIITNNGNVVPEIGQLSYSYFRGGDDDSNIEVFLGSEV